MIDLLYLPLTWHDKSKQKRQAKRNLSTLALVATSVKYLFWTSPQRPYSTIHSHCPTPFPGVAASSQHSLTTVPPCVRRSMSLPCIPLHSYCCQCIFSFQVVNQPSALSDKKQKFFFLVLKRSFLFLIIFILNHALIFEVIQFLLIIFWSLLVLMMPQVWNLLMMHSTHRLCIQVNGH